MTSARPIVEIAPHVHWIPGVMANAFLIIEPDGLTSIDTGLGGSHARILAYIDRVGRTAADLRRIILTHSDGDHTGGLADLKAATGARVYASRPEADAIARGRASREIKLPMLLRPVYAVAGRFLQSKPAQVDECVEDGFVFPVLGGLRVLATPGHTPGHISLFAPAAGVLFVGDSLIVRNGRLQGSRGAVCWDQRLANASVRAQAVLGAHTVCSGHGPVIHEAAGKFPLTIDA